MDKADRSRFHLASIGFPVPAIRAWWLTMLGLCLLVLSPSATVEAAKLALDTLNIEAGQSRLVELPAALKRVSVGDEKIADVVVISPKQLYVNGLEVGNTNITVWDNADQVMGVFKVRVGLDLTRLKEALHRLMPTEPVEVRELQGSVLLSGRVSSLEAMRKAVAVATTFAPGKENEKKLTNLIEVGGDQQVLLKVRFAEVNSRVIKRLGVNLGFFDERGPLFFTLLNGLVRPFDIEYGPNSAAFKFDISQNTSLWSRISRNGVQYHAFIDALRENGLAKILAEPNLVTSSGKEAKFLAGGEFPVPVPSINGISIEFKQFGVQLKFEPEILPDGKIRLKVAPEVSEIDFSTALVLEGFTVPGLTTRRAETQLELVDGESFAIAGLLKDDLTQTVSKIPILGDIPILGALFRSNAFQKGKTELVIVVTPQIVRPGTRKPGLTPLHGLKEPNEFQMFLLGETTTREQNPTGPPRSLKELEGGFGHELAY